MVVIILRLVFFPSSRDRIVVDFYGPELIQLTEKLVPSPDRLDVVSFSAPPEVTMLMCWTFTPKLPIAPVTPLTVAKLVDPTPV